MAVNAWNNIFTGKSFGLPRCKVNANYKYKLQNQQIL